MNYPVADFIIRIKNAASARRKEVILPYSKLIVAICKVLKKEGFLNEVSEKVVDGKKSVSVQVAYFRRVPVVTDVKIVSKPSLRVYVASADLIARSRKAFKVTILSTSKGIMTGREAQKEGLGGEVLFEIQ